MNNKEILPLENVITIPAIQSNHAVSLLPSSPDVNVATIVPSADVSVQPLFQNSSVVNIPPTNLPELEIFIQTIIGLVDSFSCRFNLRL